MTTCAAIEMHPTLTRLSLAQDAVAYKKVDHSSISLDDLENLFEILPNTNIASLSLAFNRLGDVGMELISNKLSKTDKLVELDLSNTAINTEGVLSLSRALEKDDASVASINLSDNNIAGGADELLEAVKKNSKIVSVGLSGTAVSHDYTSVCMHLLMANLCVYSSVALSTWSVLPSRL